MIDDEMVFDRYIRTPFQVKVVKITDENIEDVAAMVGEVKVKNGEKYISLDRRIVPNVSRAFVGWYVTLLGDNVRCYAPKVFKEQFMKLPDDPSVNFTFSEDEEAPPTITVAGTVELPQPEEDEYEELIAP